MIKQFEKNCKMTPHHILSAIAEKTKKEVLAGTMGPPMEEGEVSALYGALWNMVPSFGVEQGFDDSGNPKVRRIDNHKANGNNSASSRKQKVPMSSINTISAMYRLVTRVITETGDFDSRPQGATEDMKGAYRQLPLLPAHVMFAITAVFYPGVGVRYHAMHGQPFGAELAVPNFYRYSEWVCRALRRFFKLLLEHYFDDYFLIESERSFFSALFCFREGCKLLGIVLDPEGPNWSRGAFRTRSQIQLQPYHD